MESLPTNCILKFRPDQLEYVRKQHNFNKTEDMKQAIDILEEWIKMQKHFTQKKFPRNYLEKTIIESKGSLERAKQRLDRICTFRTMMPDYFVVNWTKNKFEFFEVYMNGILPHTTDEYYRTYIFKAVGSVFTQKIIMDCYRFIVLVTATVTSVIGSWMEQQDICEYILAHDYANGYIFIIDYSEVNLIEMLKHLTLTDMRQMFAIAIEGYGIRLKGIHVVTTSIAVDTFVSIVKQLISPKLGKRICVHKDFTTLYKYVPQDLLPLEYGGKEKSYKTLNDDLFTEITGEKFMKYVKEMNNAKTDESCRQKDSFNEHYLGMPGTFRTLSVD